ncbi:N-methyl-L-tryptophan oxidase [Actinopolymorpha alba]|uniref:N-methyl-L-tryptophan oxidase n=1 Tax=Actinopolymorpha alba TaxID=533267 RepID=UPI00037228CD|nr:N-methyl-L-tryptophan oxidase [Actinopolymorpha alba]
MDPEATVAVVGLGAIGAMTTWRLAERGVAVHGYERFGVSHDRGASAGQTRRFSVQSQRERRFTPLALEALDLWRELEAATGRRLLDLVGGLILGPADADALVSAARSARELGLDHEVLDSAELARRFPQHLARPGDAGVTDPMGGFVRPEASVAAAIERARDLGATIHDYTRVHAVEPADEHVVVRTPDGARRYHRVVVAPGAWARDLLPAARTTVLPRRLVQAWYLPRDPAAYTFERFPVFERVGDFKAYGFPSLDGSTIKVGIYGTAHPIVHDTENPSRTVGLDLVRSFRDVIAECLPGVHPDPSATTVGLEGYTTDGSALLGPAPDAPNVILACGFSGSGFKFAPVMGDIAADYATKGATARDVEFLSPAREVASWPADFLTRA